MIPDPVNPWQPIETVPIGQMVLLMSHTGAMFVGLIPKGSATGQDAWVSPKWVPCLCWMPLPPPPLNLGAR